MNPEHPSLSDAGDPSFVSTTRNKRRRVALACTACRTRKSRCDGARPKCTLCDDLNFDCVYLQPSSSNNAIVGKEYLAQLEQRLESVEETLNGLRRGEITLPSQEPPRSLNGTSQGHVRFDGGNLVQSSHYEAGMIAVDGDDLQDPASSEDDTDGMGAIMFTDEEDCGFFGPSSNIAFTRHISRAITRISNPDQLSCTPRSQGNSPGEGGIMSIFRAHAPTSTTPRINGMKGHDMNVYALPTEAETRDLIHKFFSDTGLLFPYIHEETFLETYDELKQSNFTKIRRSWLTLLNMVLALATSTNVRPDLTADKRAEMSDVYYERARGLSEKQMMRGTSLEVVQYLLMMGQYLQGTQKSIQTWTIHGLAVKAALQLGLHSSETSHRFSPLAREVRKRTWFGCVLLDRTLSMTFGRPATIPDDYVKLELSINYQDLLVPAPAIDTRKADSVLFFNATIKLYRLMWVVIDKLYGGNIGCAKPGSLFDIITQLLQIEHKLVEWDHDLPLHMKQLMVKDIPPEGEKIDLLDRFRVILTLRYHNLRVLLHRPVLVKFLDMTDNSESDAQEVTLLKQIGSNSIQICIQSSIKIISIVHSVVCSIGIRRGFLGAWWFSLYYTFNAALIIFATLLVCDGDNMSGPSLSVPIEALRRSLDEAIEAIQHLDNGNRMVKKCVSFLEHLKALPGSLAPISDRDGSHDLGFLNGVPRAIDGMGMPANFMGTDQSPLGMDIGEFMMEGDLDFLNYMSMPGRINHGTTLIP